MASLRDVLNHAGKKVRVTSPSGVSREGLAMRRGDIALLEPRLQPSVGETIEFLETKELFQIETSEPQESLGRVDHYRARIVVGSRG